MRTPLSGRENAGTCWCIAHGTFESKDIERPSKLYLFLAFLADDPPDCPCIASETSPNKVNNTLSESRCVNDEEDEEDKENDEDEMNEEDIELAAA
jgi:NACalpha-BTF3-like transcription factor